MTYTATRRGTYSGLVVQAILNNLSPLFFIIFQESFGFSYERLGMLVVINFVVQVVMMSLGIALVEKLGYRTPIIIAQACAALGLVLLGALPLLMNNAYAGLVIATAVGAVGGGLSELILSPIMNALPTPPNQKASAMSFLHSFFSWGQAGTILISTLFLYLAGGSSWWILPILWAVLPLANLILFTAVPLPEQVGKAERTSVKDLFLSPLFLIFILLMVCGAASELTVAQWASLFIEQGFGLSKVLGDIAGPCVFAVMMGAGRILYSVLSGRIGYRAYMLASSALCVGCYLLISLSFSPVLGLIGFALSGLAVSAMWPATLSYAAARFPLGGTLLFGALAIFGGLGCSLGPWVAGVIADNSAGGLRTGILGGAVFPAFIILLVIILNIKRKNA
ncbi:MAG: MFS transporter [Oscillospiraceae bacterium]|nr:MFS transporter [Oscillospiraceae bacterium]